MLIKSRPDGRTNSEILVQLVSDTEPGTLLTYSEIGDCLSIGAGFLYGRKETQGAVNGARVALLKNCSRALINVRDYGYRVAEASQHMLVAQRHGKRAMKQSTKQWLTLAHTKLQEIKDPAAREMHVAQLNIAGSIIQATRALAAKTAKIEDILKRNGLT